MPPSRSVGYREPGSSDADVYDDAEGEDDEPLLGSNLPSIPRGGSGWWGDVRARAYRLWDQSLNRIPVVSTFWPDLN